MKIELYFLAICPDIFFFSHMIAPPFPYGSERDSTKNLLLFGEILFCRKSFSCCIKWPARQEEMGNCM